MFFFDHLREYYNWAKIDKVSEEESKRNKQILGLTQVPNIFVGHI